MVGRVIAMPPRELLGWFTQPGDCEGVAEWVRNAPGARLAVALDMLCYGGLVASRTPAVDAGLALSRLSALHDLRQRRPEAIVFAFNTITRLGKTVACAADLDEHLLLRSYSQLVDRVQRLGDEEARGELEQVEGRLDPDHLAEYMAVRRRNHALNRAAVQLVAEGVIDYLVLSQEDSAPTGIHLPEQLALRDQIEEFRVGDRVALTCGADEMTMMLLARHLTAEAELSPGIAVDLAAESGGNVVPLFESEPLRQTIFTHLDIAGGRRAQLADCDALLFVHTPINAQPDIAEAPPQGQAPTLAMQAESVAGRVEGASAAGRLFGVADVAYCNGADPELVGALERGNALGRLTAFAGWNTAANTLGTVISQLSVMATARPGARLRPEAVSRFVAARLIDDYAYQSVTRPKAVAHAQEIGADPFLLGEARGELEAFVSAQLAPLAHRYASFALADRAADADPVQVSLPWSRLFEVEVRISSAATSAGPKNCQ